MAESVTIQEVWASNIDEEFENIQTAINNGFCYASFDTEFPGIIYDPLPRHIYSSLSPERYYSIMKQNVDKLRIIQLGLTLFNDKRDNTPSCYVWQFNFSDFDKNIHPHNEDSISLLEKQGIDFSENKRNGVNSLVFAQKIESLVLPRIQAWITFHGSYDFALLIKILYGPELPNNVRDFMMLLSNKFGVGTFDVKLMARFLGMHGGLENIGKNLELDRVVGKSHQAGSDSLLTHQVFMKLWDEYYSRTNFIWLNNKLYGLTSLQDNSYYIRMCNVLKP